MLGLVCVAILTPFARCVRYAREATGFPCSVLVMRGTSVMAPRRPLRHALEHGLSAISRHWPLMIIDSSELGIFFLSLLSERMITSLSFRDKESRLQIPSDLFRACDCSSAQRSK